MTITINGTTGIAGVDGSAGTPAVQGSDTNTGEFFPAADTIAWTTGGSERMRIDSSGNVGIGTSSPTQKLHVVSASGGTTSRFTNTNAGNFIDFYESNTSTRLGYVGTPDGTNWNIHNDKNGYIAFDTNNTERARILAGGNLLVAQTAAVNGEQLGVTSAGNVFLVKQTTSNGTCRLTYLNGSGLFDYFYNTATSTQIGSISSNGTATAYNTSSDYRLKENIAPMTGALAKVTALKPVTYKWKADGSAGEGFIAHELAEVCPQAVSGEKDAVDAEGNPVYQGIDTSFLVATLTAAIKEQQALIESLTTRIAALEAK